MEINQLTPAQSLMITAPFGVSGKSLIKYAFLDLIFNGFLNVYKEWRLPHPNDARERLYTFVSRGENFDKWFLKKHQIPFMEPFFEGDYEYQVRTLIQNIYKDVNKGTGYKSKLVYKELQSAKYFTTSLGLKYLNVFILSSKGSKMKRMINEILIDAEKELPKLLVEDPAGARELLRKLGPNVLLLDNFNDELLEQLRPLFEGIGKEYSDQTGTLMDQLDAFELLFYSFLDTIDLFDASFESFDSTFDFSGDGFGDLGGFDGGDFGDFGGFD